MKKTGILIVMLIVVALSLSMVACTGEEHEVVIKIEKGYDLSEGNRLIDYMEYLEDKDKLEYDEEKGMIISINGIENTLNSYWMLYTDDQKNSNEAWGSYEYKDKSYSSASLGATELVIEKGYTYIWVYQSF